MSVFRNTQIAKSYKVSNTTVANWIKSAEKGENELQLTTLRGKRVVLDNQHNRETINWLVAKGKKHISLKEIVLKPKEQFFQIFNQAEVIEIITNLKTSLEIPYKYTYYDIGANLWDKDFEIHFSENLEKNLESNLIQQSLDSILFKFRNFKKVNIVDLGCGNGIPAIPILNKFIGAGYQTKYLAIDISQAMIDKNKSKILAQFPNLEYASHKVDFNFSNLGELLFLEKTDTDTANLLLYLGGTLGNERFPDKHLSNFRDAMGVGDYLLIANSISMASLNFRDFEAIKYDYQRTTWILEALNLNGYYPDQVLSKYDPLKFENSRRIPILSRIRLNIEVAGIKTDVIFSPGDEILVYKYKKYSEQDLVNLIIRNGFTIEHLTTNRNRTYGIAMLSPGIVF